MLHEIAPPDATTNGTDTAAMVCVDTVAKQRRLSIAKEHGSAASPLRIEHELYSTISTRLACLCVVRYLCNCTDDGDCIVGIVSLLWLCSPLACFAGAHLLFTLATPCFVWCITIAGAGTIVGKTRLHGHL
jgi:hypothetical protein